MTQVKQERGVGSRLVATHRVEYVLFLVCAVLCIDMWKAPGLPVRVKYDGGGSPVAWLRYVETTCSCQVAFVRSIIDENPPPEPN